MKKIFYLSLLLFGAIDIYSMESSKELAEQDIVMQEVPYTVINILKTEEYRDKNNKHDFNKYAQGFVGEYSLQDILPLDIWRVIARFLDFNDKALVYYFAPRVGLSEKQAVKIAIAFYNDLFKKIKKTKDFKTLLKLNENCFDYYRHEPSKVLLRKLIQEQNKHFLEFKNEYSQIHKQLIFPQKMLMRASIPQQEIIDFWNKVLKNLEANYSLQINLSSLSDEKLLDLSMLLSNLNKLYNIYRVSGIHLSIKKKVLISCMSAIAAIVFISLGFSLENYGYLVAIGMCMCAFQPFHWFINKKPFDEIYLAQINIFADAVEKEILKRKEIQLS